MESGQYEATIEILTERLADLEFELRNQDWQRLTWESENEFSREGLRQIVRLARLMYLKNPLIRRGVNVQADYVFGQGVSIRAEDTTINQVIQGFVDDERNQVELFGHQALLEKEIGLQLDGNLFLTLFTHRLTGRVVVRTLPADEVDEIICDPQDRRSPWYYRRMWNETQFTPGSGQTTSVSRTAYYPDWRYMPRTKPQVIGGSPVMWDAPVLHVRSGGLADMRFGVSELYASLDWARAYKEFLEDWATITRAYSRFAFNLTAKGGARGVAAAKSALSTTYGNGGVGIETNPPPVTGATFIGSEGVKLDPVRTSGATTKMEDGRRLLLMVAAGQGLPETFYGDVSVGTLATATSLDRPTELKFRSRQKLWESVLRTLCRYALAAAVKAPRSPLQGTVTIEDDGTPSILVRGADGTMAAPDIDVAFPPLIEHAMTDTVQAILAAAARLPDERLIASLLLSALGQSDVDAQLDTMYPADGAPAPASEQAMVEAARELRTAIKAATRRLG